MQNLISKLGNEFLRNDFTACRGALDTLIVDGEVPLPKIVDFIVRHYHISVPDAISILEMIAWESLEIRGYITVQ